MLKERLAELCHEQWSGWMKYLFSKGESNDNDGTWTMPAWAVDRWGRQMYTPYHELSEEEKNSDRKEADKFLEVFKQQTAFPPAGAKVADGRESEVNKFKTRHGLWSSYPDYPRRDWITAVANRYTNLGYWEWVEHKVEEAENDPCPRCGIY